MNHTDVDCYLEISETTAFVVGNGLLNKPQNITNGNETGLNINNLGKVTTENVIKTVRNVTFAQKGECVTIVWVGGGAVVQGSVFTTSDKTVGTCKN
jgi:hypothetical protein